MSKKETGGPAFPGKAVVAMKITQNEDGKNISVPVYEYQEGMTLRDYFAASASEKDIMEQQEIAYKDFCETSGLAPSSWPRGTEVISRSEAKYLHADAMLKEREK